MDENDGIFNEDKVDLGKTLFKVEFLRHRWAVLAYERKIYSRLAKCFKWLNTERLSPPPLSDFGLYCKCTRKIQGNTMITSEFNSLDRISACFMATKSLGQSRLKPSIARDKDQQ